MHLCIILNVSLFSSCQLFCPGQFGDVVWRHMNPEQPVQRDRLCLNILNNQLFLVLCFDVLMFCLFVLFFILVLFICSIFSHLHIIMYDREIIFIFCYFVDVNFHHNVCAFFHLKFGILEFLISKVYLYCLFMLLHLAFALCAPQVPFVCLYGYGRVLHGGLAIRGGGGEPWVQKGLWLWSVSDQMCILSF